MTWRPDTKFNLSGGDSSIVYTDSGTDSSLNAYPFLVSSKIQLLYTAAEINGVGVITGIGLPVGVAGSITPRTDTTAGSQATLTVRLGHTSLSDLTTTFASNFNAGTPVTVTNAQTFTIPAGIPDGGYVWLPLPDGAFTYNGTDNLIVDIESTSVSGNASSIYDSSGTNTHYTRVSTQTYPWPATVGPSDRDHLQYFIKFRFAGGTMDVITPESTDKVAPFSAAHDNKLQNLYRAAELGTKGTITKVAFRLSNADSTNTAYNSFEVVLGHSAMINPELSATFSANMADAQTVFSGTFTVPAGLKIGDWIEIPLSTPFAYDGKRDLVVQVSSLQGAAENRTKMSLDATRYKNRRAFISGSNTATTANFVQNELADLRLFLQ